MKCPKCGYERTSGETAPDWQCPSCHVAYAKVAEAGRVAPARPVAGSGNSSGKFAAFIAALVAIGVGVVLTPVLRPAAEQEAGGTPGQMKDYAQSKVIMYSLTTCGYCNIKRGELKTHNIPFVEYFIDQDPARQRELFEKLLAAGYKGGGVGTPTFEVNGTMLPNNPPLKTIRKYL